MNQNMINQGKIYSNFGLNSREENQHELEINNRIAKYNKNVGKKDSLLRDKYVSKECKTMYKSIYFKVYHYINQSQNYSQLKREKQV